jgi:hypothetical protein
MTRSYEYYEHLPESDYLRNPKYFDKELEIAKGIVKRIPKRSVAVQECKGCGKGSVEVFFTKWDVPYFRCRECGTIFANAGAETIAEYNRDPELISLRSSEDYQKNITEKRKGSWSEIVDWVSYRSFRYLGKNKGLNVIDDGNRYSGLAEVMKVCGICSDYVITDSILSETTLNGVENVSADVILCLDRLQQSANPVSDLKKLNSKLRIGGLLYLGLKVGTGFDMLVLKEHSNVFPYEHTFIPTAKSLELIMSESGFEILDESTPGMMDVTYVLDQKDHIDPSQTFVKSFMETADAKTLNEFQYFLQKSGMSSYARMVARKVRE